MQGVAIESMSTLFSRIIASDVSDPVLPDALGYGSFTRYGEVGELLMQRDDMFVIMRHGDKLDLTFSPPAQPEQGMQRGFILKANLYYKTFSVANTVEPLPFHDMSIYPYEFPETYPQDQEHLEYINTYNTREYDEN